MDDERQAGVDIDGGDVHARDIDGGDVHYQYNSPAPRKHNTIPHQNYFFGREKELATLADALSPEARSWGALIDGRGGS